MKSQSRIFIAFILNLAFSVFEFFGGIITGSVAILSDALHDLGDAAGIGISFFLEKKSKRQPDAQYTYGYGRYSVLGSVITTLILLVGSITVLYHAVHRILHPTQIHYNGMIFFAVLGVIVNSAAACFTHGGHCLNQKAVNLHMLEDVLGWIVVLLGAIVIKFTGFTRIDPILSAGVAVFILVSAIKNLTQSLELFLEKTPRGIDIDTVKAQLSRVDGVLDIHHIHLWSIDGQTCCATMHVVTNGNFSDMKKHIREQLRALGICHATLEPESESEQCEQMHCHPECTAESLHHHHH